jgi:GDP-L-fucose synthase
MHTDPPSPRPRSSATGEEALFTGPVEPSSEAYAVAKQAAIVLCKAYRRQHDAAFTTIIPADCYGPGDDFHPESSHVGAALLARFHEARVAGAEEVVVWGSGKPQRDFLFVDDLARGACVLAARPEIEGPINLGSGKGTSILELATSIREVVGFEGRLRFDASRPDGMPLKILDTRRMEALGWTPQVDLAVGLARMYAWYRAQAEPVQT